MTKQQLEKANKLIKYIGWCTERIKEEEKIKHQHRMQGFTQDMEDEFEESIRDNTIDYLERLIRAKEKELDNL